MEGSVAELKTWYTELDSKLKAVVSELNDKDIEAKEVEHGGYNFSLQFQLNVYAEALIIFSGKVSIYLKAMSKDIPKQWQDWIG